MSDEPRAGPSLTLDRLSARGLWTIALTREPLALAAWAAVALGLVLRLVARPGLPLWLDETWTGAIIAQDSLREVLRQSLLDANAPLYFALMHGWSLLFGLSNGALRLPALIFGAAAPLLALIPVKGIPRDVRYLWCALTALWVPGIWYSQEARCYTMLLFLTMASTVAYVHLLARPDLRRATLWALIGALAILTHYYALVLVGCQGLAYLALHRRRALRTWPAALMFAPALAWTIVHLPHLARYADPHIAWYNPLELSDLATVAFFILGDMFMQGDMRLTIGLIALAAVPLLARSAGGAPLDAGPERPSRAAWIAAGSAGLAVAVVLAAAVLSTSFVIRYLIPFMPGLMLSMAMLAVWLGRRWSVMPVAVVFVFAISAAGWSFEGKRESLKTYNFQAASDALMGAGIRNLAFLWDNPSAQIGDRGQLASLGGFFFRRAGVAVTVEPIVVAPGEDPHSRLLGAANAKPDSAILWLYDVQIRGTAAKSYPPRIERDDPAWRCRQFGRGRIGVLACERAPLSKPAEQDGP